MRVWQLSGQSGLIESRHDMSNDRLDCRQVIAQVIEHLEQHPDWPLDARLAEHLESCRDCHEVVDMERRLRGAGASRITCEEVIELIFIYLDRELDRETSLRIDRHLESCRDCFSRAEFERRLRERFDEAVDEKAPNRLKQRVRGLLDEF